MKIPIGRRIVMRFEVLPLLYHNVKHENLRIDQVLIGVFIDKTFKYRRNNNFDI